MKKLLTLLISCFLITCSFTKNIFAQKEVGLYHTGSFSELKNNNLQDNQIGKDITVYYGDSSDFAIIYSNGNSYENISHNNEIITNNNGIIFENGKWENEENILKLSTNTKGATATISYLGQSLNITAGYSDYFGCDADKDPTNDISTVARIYKLKLNEEKTIKFYKHNNGTITEITDVNINSDHISYDKGNNKIKAISLGSYELKFDDNKPGIIFNVQNDDGGQGDGPRPDLTEISVVQGIVPENLNTRFVFEYNGANYRIGLGNGSSDSGTLHIDDGGMVDLSINDDRDSSGCGGSVLIGKLDDQGEIAEPANSEIYGLFSNLTYKVVANDSTGITAGYYRENLEKLNTVTDSIIVEISKNKLDYKQKDKAMIEVSFVYGGENHTIQFGIEIEKPLKFSLNANSVEELNNKFADETALASAAGSMTIDRDTNIEIMLDSSKTYTGIIEINCGNNFHDLIIDGNGATVEGIKTKESISQIKNVNFVAPDNNAYGLILDNDTFSDNAHNLYIVQNCNFTGYKYGIYSNGYGLISGIENCTFTNCDIGIYTNSMTSKTYSDSLGDTFIDCKTGIEIERIPNTSTPYQFVMRNMNFISNSSNTTNLDYSDYKIHCDGKFFYTGNLYGKYDGSYTDNNDLMSKVSIRSAKISYIGTNTSKTKIYTNPCIRHPQQEQAALGIDPADGLYTAILSGDDAMSHINVNDLNTNINLDICQKGTGNQLAVLSFKEDN